MKKADHSSETPQHTSSEHAAIFRELNDLEWLKIAHLFEQVGCEQAKSGRPVIDARTVLNAILWKFQTNQSWLLLPGDYPSASSCKGYLKKWQQQGLMQQVALMLVDSFPALQVFLPQSAPTPPSQPNSLLSILSGIDHPLSK